MPPKQAVAPDSATHRMYVRELDIYLGKVARNPNDFEKKVEMRREARFGGLWAKVAVSELTPQGGVGSTVNWLSVAV